MLYIAGPPCKALADRSKWGTDIRQRQALQGIQRAQICEEYAHPLHSSHQDALLGHLSQVYPTATQICIRLG